MVSFADMKILGIETSCDDTSISIIEISGKKEIRVLSNIISSQVNIHKEYGGIVPHLAAREHEKNLPKVLKLSLKEADIKDIKKDIGLIAVTEGPGLSPALWRGIKFAEKLAKKHKKHLVGVNHLEGHIYSNWINSTKTSQSKVKNPQIKFPVLNLIVSGGHTMLVLMNGLGKYKIIGETRDDAAGEAFDKIARLLGLGFPGGPAIAKKSSFWKQRQTTSKNLPEIKLPRPMINHPDFDFSFSGLKTATLYKIKDIKKTGKKLTANLVNQIAYETQNAIVEVLMEKAIKAAKRFKIKTLALSGGVSANKFLREQLKKEGANLKEVGLLVPEMSYTTDNAAMIALAGYFKYKKRGADRRPLKAKPNLMF